MPIFNDDATLFAYVCRLEKQFDVILIDLIYVL
jgi:hypothetical protein